MLLRVSNNALRDAAIYIGLGYDTLSKVRSNHYCSFAKAFFQQINSVAITFEFVNFKQMIIRTVNRIFRQLKFSTFVRELFYCRLASKVSWNIYINLLLLVLCFFLMPTFSALLNYIVFLFLVLRHLVSFVFIFVQFPIFIVQFPNSVLPFSAVAAVLFLPL